MESIIEMILDLYKSKYESKDSKRNEYKMHCN